MNRTLVRTGATSLAGLAAAALTAITPASAALPNAGPQSIDGTYELVKHVMPNGRVVRPPLWTAIYTMRKGRFSLNLFFKNTDGTLASESTIGRYTFTRKRYCEWITWTTRNNLDHPGATNEAPSIKDPCAPVTAKGARVEFAPPGENVVMTVSADGFVAKIDGGGVDYWRKIR